MTLQEALERMTGHVNFEIYIIDWTGAVQYKETANLIDLIRRIEEYDGYEVVDIYKRARTFLLQIYLEKKGR